LPALFPKNWPHHSFIESILFDKVLVNGSLPLDFDRFIKQCRSNSLNYRSLRIGGTVSDLEMEKGLLDLLTAMLRSVTADSVLTNGYKRESDASNSVIAADAGLFGKVVLGKNVCIGEKAVVIGPTILGDNVKIGRGTFVPITEASRNDYPFTETIARHSTNVHVPILQNVMTMTAISGFGRDFLIREFLRE
ncbi:MAG: hypothetical protein ACYSWP_21295, partial [Planctomycetota bacterium]|jgi:hypothetical protein